MRIAGVAAAPGIGLAAAWRLVPDELPVPSDPVDEPDAEADRLAAAMAAVAADLQRRAADAGGEAGEILTAQAMMAADPELADAAAGLVRTERLPAARAILDAGEVYALALADSGNDYLAARASDVRDVCRRIAADLVGAPGADVSSLHEPVVIVADDLAPADTAVLDPALVRGLATQAGSRTSHTAIVARALGVPAVVAAPGLLEAVEQGVVVAVDGDDGVVVIDPQGAELAEIERRVDAARAVDEAAPRGPAMTADGHHVELAANVGSVAELRAALAAGAVGIGLLRTELAYLNREEPPGQDEQQALFAELAALLDGGRLVVRTFDFGADKPVAFLPSTREENPALGVRGLRLARRHPDLLDAQLRAVAAAAEHGRLAVMAPMVTTVADAEWFVQRVAAAGAPNAALEVGAMVEVPSAVLLADELAQRLDFLSVGTNDLTQYLHAADRQLGELAELQDPFNPAVLRAVAAVCEAGARHGAWIGVCGEAAGDPDWAVVAVGLGVSELSMGAASLRAVRTRLGQVTLDDCRDAARAAIAAADASTARAAVEVPR